MVILASVAFAISADTATIFARSSPAGAEVYLDGAKVSSGTTPIEIKEVSPGRHELRFVFPDAKEALREVTVRAGGQASASASWSSARAPGAPKPASPGRKARAIVNVVSNPASAKVSVDGKYVGKAPCTARNLSAGTHKFVLKKGGFEDYETTVELKAGETRLLEAELVQALGEIGAVEEGEAVEVPEIPKVIEKQCPACLGTGRFQTMGCPKCNHVGYDEKKLEACLKCGRSGTVPAKCNACAGAGSIGGRTCPRCSGTGKPACSLCKGKGKIPADNPDYYRDKYDIIDCPYCHGRCVDKRVVRCQPCSGNGRLNLKRTERTASGSSRFWTMQITCWSCKGSGESRPLCGACRGRGYVRGSGQVTWGLAGGGQSFSPCPKCGGTGKLFSWCQGCKGRGWLKRRKRR